jgi:hypothetical protein
MMMRKNPIIAIANPVDIVAEAAKAVKAAKAAAIAAHALEVAGVLVHFDTAYDFKTNRLTAFQQLCVDLDVEVGTSLTQCKKVTRFSSPSPTNHMLTICCRTSRKPPQRLRLRPRAAGWGRRPQRPQVSLEDKAPSRHAGESLQEVPAQEGEGE